MIDLDGIKARLARVWGRWPTKGVLAPGADEFGPKAWSAHGPLRCHATEQGRARGWTQANADADFIAHAPADIGALIAEVELLRTGRDVSRAYADRLEAEALVLRGERERAAVLAWLREHACPDCPDGYAPTPPEHTADTERAAVLAYLRAAYAPNTIVPLPDFLAALLRMVEKGEHHRKDNE